MVATSRSPGPSADGQRLSSTEYATHEAAADDPQVAHAEAHRQQVAEVALGDDDQQPGQRQHHAPNHCRGSMRSCSSRAPTTAMAIGVTA
jgi:hypothetical protein